MYLTILDKDMYEPEKEGNVKEVCVDRIPFDE
jgi:hypothetical protein